MLSNIFNLSFLLERSRDFEAQTCFYACLSKAFPKAGSTRFTCSITCIRLEGSISPPVRHTLISILPDGNADILLLFC